MTSRNILYKKMIIPEIKTKLKLSCLKALEWSKPCGINQRFGSAIQQGKAAIKNENK